MAIDFKQHVSACQAGFLGFASRLHLRYGRRTVEVSSGNESDLGNAGLVPDYAQAYAAEKIVPRNLFDAAHVRVKEPRKIGVRQRLSSLLDALRIMKELAPLRIILVHPLKQVAQASLPIALLAHRQVQRQAQQLSDVVIGNAALRLAIVR